MRNSEKTRRHFLLIILLFLGFCLLLKLPTLKFPHTEPDELVYWQLSENLLKTGSYNLQGTEILPRLSPYIYDRKLFHHPPLFPILLIPFVLQGLKQSAIIIPWLGHLLCIVAVGIIGKCILSSNNLSISPKSTIFWLPLLGITIDPVMTFVSRKLWLDGLLAGLTTFSVALFYVCCHSKHRRLMLVFAGSVLGLAALVKLSALIIIPVAIYILFHFLKTPRERIEAFLCAGLPLLFLLLPWFITFYKHFGVFIPSWLKPDAWLLQRYPFVRAAVEQPVYYYFKKLMLLEPLIIVCAIWCFNKLRRVRNVEFMVPLLWFAVYFIIFSYLGASGYGFQMRYLAPLCPSIYVILYSLISCSNGNKSVFVLLSALSIVYAGMGGAIYLFNSRPDEIGSMLGLAGIIK